MHDHSWSSRLESKKLIDDVECAEDVDLEGRAKVLHFDIFAWNERVACCGIGDQDINRADLFQDGRIVEADITDREAITAAYAEIADINKGSLDVLINNAGLVNERSAYKTLVDDDPTALEDDLMTSFRANVVRREYC